jgi:PAS domain S-box-containing protein
MTMRAPGAAPPAAVPAATPLDPAHIGVLLDMSADAIITASPEERITSWNRGAAEMFGWTADEMVGRVFDILLPDEERVRGELDWIHRTTLAQGAIRNHETRRRRKDGSVFDVSLTRTAVRGADGELVGFTAILRDISDRKRLERSLLAAERLATAGQVAAGVAHEIGAPLTAIAMTVEHMLRLRCQSCAGAEQMKVLQSQTDRIARLARQLVDLAKPAGVTRTPLQVNDVVAVAASLLRPQFAQKGARLEVELEPGLRRVSADGAQLQQVVLNLLFNAHRAVAPGSGEVFVGTHRRDDRFVSITVRDNGAGIAEEDLPHVFTPFFSRTGGTGLGLAIAAQIVQAHGGTIDADSAPGRGAVCTIVLPVVESETDA